MSHVGIGFAVRRIGEISAYPKAGLADICTVARCRPSGRMLLEDGDAANPFGLCDRVEDALVAARNSSDDADAAEALRVYGYELLPVIHTEAGERKARIEAPALVEPIPASFMRIGYDAVEFQDNGHGGSFGCSPLSCNGMVSAMRTGGEHDLPGVSVNAYCLVDSLEEARELARYFALRKPEPGPYAVVAVYRQ